MDEFLEPEQKLDLREDMDEDMLVDLAEGKKVGNMKLTKNQRREVKHAIKRGENINILDFLNEN